MEKKKYFDPEMEVLEIDNLVVLADSGDGTQDAEGEGVGGDSSGADY